MAQWLNACLVCLTIPFKEMTFVQHLSVSGNTKETFAKHNSEAGVEKKTKQNKKTSILMAAGPGATAIGCFFADVEDGGCPGFKCGRPLTHSPSKW